MRKIFRILQKQKWLIVLVLVSLFVRMFILGLVVQNKAKLLGDERPYFKMAYSFSIMLSDFSQGTPINNSNVDSLYYTGRWPPLHPILMGTAIYLSQATDNETQIAVARATVAIISSLTTGVIFLLGKRLFGVRVGILAAGLHIISLESIVYSNRMMSEVPYGFFIIIAIYSLLNFLETEDIKSRVMWILFYGIALGLAGWVRASVITFLILIPILIAIFSKIRILYCFFALLIPLIVLSPWLSTLYQREGKFILLATSGGTNIGLYNNSFFDVAYVYHDDGWKKYNEAVSYIQSYAKAKDISLSNAGFEIGVQFVIENPILSFQRVGYRMMRHLSYDSVLYYFMRLGYPPISAAGIIFINIISIISHIAFMILIIIGVVHTWKSFKYKYLWLLLSVGTLLLSTLSVSVPRFHHVTILMYLPFAGYALGKRHKWTKQSKVAVVLGSLIVTLVSLLFFLPAFKVSRPPSYYRDLVSQIDQILNRESQFVDKITFVSSKQVNTEKITVRILDEAYELRIGGQVFTWSPENKSEKVVRIDGYSPTKPLEIELTTIIDGKISVARLSPIVIDAWETWQPTGIDGIEYKWNSRR